MKSAYSRGEKALFIAPLLFVALGIGAWRWQQKRPVRLDVPFPIPFIRLSFSPDGKKLAMASNDASISTPPTLIFDLETRSKICEIESPQVRQSEMVWSPDSNRIAWAYLDDPIGQTAANTNGLPSRQIGFFSVWDAQSGVSFGKFPCETGREKSLPLSLRFSKDGSKLISNGKPPALFDATTGERLRVFSTNPSAQVNYELGLVAQFGGKDSRVQVLDLKTGRKVWESHQTELSRKFLGLYPRDELRWNGDILTVYYAVLPSKQNPNAELVQEWLLWDGKTRKPLITPAGENKPQPDFNSDGKTLYFINQKQAVPVLPNQSQAVDELVVWDYRLNRELWHKPINSYLDSFSWSPDGKWLSQTTRATEDAPWLLQIYDRNGHLHLQQEAGDYLAVWSPDSSQIAIITPQKKQIEVVKIED